MEERELMNSCPICGCLHDGADDLCEDCIKRVDREVKRIQSARDALITDMLIEAAGANETLMRIIEEGLNNETT